ncbi:MAG: DNA-processing protein DprA [Chloroflexota bacterium]|jgi:DNA processing protein
MHAEYAALLTLVNIDGLGPQRINRLLEHFGTPEAIISASYQQLQQTGLPVHLCSELIKQRQRFDGHAEYQRFHEQGIQLLATHDDDYPPLLKHIATPPTLLFVRGNVSAFRLASVAIVGTRQPSTYGHDVTQRLASDLAQRHLCIVSGLALGVDTIAHHSALDANGSTIAVLPSGVDFIYPASNRTLAERILAHSQSALVSEFYPGTRASAPLFPARNRLISGLAQATIVTEAGERSGAMITVKAALDQGREVMAVPGSVFAPKSAGCLNLIHQGATPIRHADDVCHGLGYTVEASRQSDDPLLNLLSTARHIDDICRITQRHSADILGELLMRELRGEIIDQGNGFYVWRQR